MLPNSPEFTFKDMKKSPFQLLSFILLLFALSASAADVVNNLGSANVNGEAFANSSRLGGQSFQTGGQQSTLDSITVKLRNFTTSSTATISLRADGGGVPGSVLETLGNVTFTSSGSQDFTKNSSVNPTLAANTKYWVVVGYVAGDFDFRVTSSTGGNGTGTMLADDDVSANGGASWLGETAENFFIAVAATEIAPPVFNLTGSVSMAEGDSGNTAFTFTVTRSQDTSGANTVDFAVTGNGADAIDFGGSFPNGTVSFAASETTKTITVNASGDTAVEFSENFTVTLSNPSGGASINSATATGTILNDDSQFAVMAQAATLAEGNSGNTVFAFEVARDGEPAGRRALTLP
jgi:hypothetical protein